MIWAAWFQARSATTAQQQEADRQEKHLRRHLARRYLYQLMDAVDSLLHRVDNWAHREGARYSEGLHPGYWEMTSLYVIARALGAERIMALEGVYVDLEALSKGEVRLKERVVEDAIGKALGHGLFHYHRLTLAEACLDRHGDGFRLLTYSEFLHRYEDPLWNLEVLLDPVRQAFASLRQERLDQLDRSLTSLSKRIREDFGLSPYGGCPFRTVRARQRSARAPECNCSPREPAARKAPVPTTPHRNSGAEASRRVLERDEADRCNDAARE